MGDDDEESDGVDDEEWEEADGVPLGMGLDGMDQDPMGFRHGAFAVDDDGDCLLYTSPSPRDKRQSRMPSSA